MKLGRHETLKRVGRALLAILWGIVTLEIRSPGFVAWAPAWIRRLERGVR